MFSIILTLGQSILFVLFFIEIICIFHRSLLLNFRDLMGAPARHWIILLEQGSDAEIVHLQVGELSFHLEEFEIFTSGSGNDHRMLIDERFIQVIDLTCIVHRW